METKLEQKVNRNCTDFSSVQDIETMRRLPGFLLTYLFLLLLFYYYFISTGLLSLVTTGFYRFSVFSLQ